MWISFFVSGLLDLDLKKKKIFIAMLEKSRKHGSSR